MFCFAFQVKVRSDFVSKVPIFALTPQSAQNSRISDKIRTKSVPAFSARKVVSENNGNSVYLSTLSERLDHAEKIENGFDRNDRICETPKRVSFNVGVLTSTSLEDPAKSKAASV